MAASLASKMFKSVEMERVRSEGGGGGESVQVDRVGEKVKK